MVHNYIVKRRQKHPLHFTLLDPGKMGPDNLVELATQTAEAGTDGFMIGGSTVMGAGVSNTQTIPAQLEFSLHAKGYANVRVVNAGIGGFYSMWESQYLLTELLYYQPDLVIVFNGFTSSKSIRNHKK